MKISSIGKFIDQPLIVNSLQRKMPVILIGSAAAFGAVDTLRKPKEERKTAATKNAITLAVTVAASLLGTRGLKVKGKRIIPGLMENVPKSDVIKKQTDAINNFIKTSDPKDNQILNILDKAKTKILSPKETNTLITQIPEDTKGKQELFNVIFSQNKDITSKEIFSEIGRLSLMGAVPVAGGITGGMLADKVTKTETKESKANKIKEGVYQYLANIFMCNVGAAGALFGAEQLQKAGKIQKLTPTKKLGVILGGITATGIMGGSYIANFISKKFLDPMFDKDKHHKGHGKSLYAERKPEPLDVALHADDIATAGVLSGFKWIEPALPIMYLISGYRAGTGYRNNNKDHHRHACHHTNCAEKQKTCAPHMNMTVTRKNISKVYRPFFSSNSNKA